MTLKLLHIKLNPIHCTSFVTNSTLTVIKPQHLPTAFSDQLICVYLFCSPLMTVSVWQSSGRTSILSIFWLPWWHVTDWTPSSMWFVASQELNTLNKYKNIQCISPLQYAIHTRDHYRRPDMPSVLINSNNCRWVKRICTCVLVLELGRQKLHPERSSWNSASRWWNDSDIMDQAF